ncbi:hypothetical protein [Streptomyces sp. NPDC058735]|uniref:hypothetical protein n=1 Tax=unclassified Streptomyces TaxID=2593676 RepID=UPI00369A0538
MGSLRVTVCTSVLAVVALAPPAYAVDAGGVRVTPARPVPGGDVTLRVADCARRTAVATSAAFVADARLTVTGPGHELAGDSRVRSTLRPGTYAVRVTCDGSVRSGTLTVRAKDAQGAREGERRGARAVPGPSGQGARPADDPSAPGTTTPHAHAPQGDVRSGGRPPAPADERGSPVPRSGGQPSTPAADGSRPGAYPSPVAPVQAGGGGAAEQVAARQEHGAAPGTAQGVTGLVLAGVAAVAVALGGLRRRRGTG